MASFADISIRFSANLKQFSTEMQNVQRDMKKFGKEINKIGVGITAGLSAPLTLLGYNASRTFATFEMEMAKLQAVSGATAVELDALTQNAMALGESTMFSASQAAELSLNLSKLGFRPQEILDATSGILDLAIATGEDLASSATVAASTIRGFGMEAAEATRVADIMAASFSASALDLGKFQTAMAVLAPVANSAGVSIEQATGQLAVLVNAGIDASTAGTGLRNIFLDISSKGMTLEEALSSIVNATDANSRAMELFGKRGATVATVLAQNYSAAQDFTKQFQNSEGAAKAMARVMEDTLTGSLDELSSAWESVNIQIGQKMAPAIRQLAGMLSTLLTRFKYLSPETQRWLVVIGALAAALGPLLVTIGFMATNVIPGLITAFTALKAAMLANPFTALAIAIAAVVSALVLYTKTTNEAATVTKMLSDVRSTAASYVAKERSELDSLLKVARDEMRSKKEREEAIKKINQLSPEYLSNISLETINTNEAAQAIENYISALNKRAAARAAEEKKTELFRKKLEKEIEVLGGKNTLSNKFWSIFGIETNQFKGIEDFNAKLKEALDTGQMTIEQVDQMRSIYEPYIQKREKELAVINAQIDALDAYITVSENESSVISGLTEDYEKLASGREKVQGVLGDLAAVDTQTDFERRIANWEKEIEILERAQRKYPEASAEYRLFAEQILSYSRMIEQAQKGVQGSFLSTVGSVNEYTIRMRELSANLSQSINELLYDTSLKMVEGMASILGSIAAGYGNARDIANSMLSTMGDLLIQLGRILIQIGLGLEAMKLALDKLNPVIATIAGLGLIAFGSMMKGRVRATAAFADGGVVYGPTLGLVGEYVGARNDPEVISPLSKLKKLIEPATAAVTPYIVGAKIEGSALRLVLNRTDEKTSRFGGK